MVVRDGRGWVIKPDHELKQSKAIIVQMMLLT